MIGSNLQYCREELQMTQTELGNILGVSKSTVSGWENGYSIIPFKKLIKFCNTYNYSLDFVCGITRKNKKYPNPIPSMEKIGNNLRHIRRKLGIKQKQIAKDCSISQTTYSTYENGKYLVSTLTLYTISTKYNISMDQIVR